MMKHQWMKPAYFELFAYWENLTTIWFPTNLSLQHDTSPHCECLPSRCMLPPPPPPDTKNLSFDHIQQIFHTQSHRLKGHYSDFVLIRKLPELRGKDRTKWGSINLFLTCCIIFNVFHFFFSQNFFGVWEISNYSSVSKRVHENIQYWLFDSRW